MSLDASVVRVVDVRVIEIRKDHIVCPVRRLDIAQGKHNRYSDSVASILFDPRHSRPRSWTRVVPPSCTIGELVYCVEESLFLNAVPIVQQSNRSLIDHAGTQAMADQVNRG